MTGRLMMRLRRRHFIPVTGFNEDVVVHSFAHAPTRVALEYRVVSHSSMALLARLGLLQLGGLRGP
jgi:hypothetical protein